MSLDPRFLQAGFDKQLSHLIEECGEVLAAAGKTQRWGPDSTNPDLDQRDAERNIDWLRRELKDLRQAMDRLEATIGNEFRSAQVLARDLDRMLCSGCWMVTGEDDISWVHIRFNHLHSVTFCPTCDRRYGSKFRKMLEEGL